MKKQEEELKSGYIVTRPVREDELYLVTEPDSEYRLVYVPGLDSPHGPVYWAKRMKSSVVLFAVFNKNEVELVQLEDVKKLVFISEEGEYNVKWQQWKRSIEMGEVDSSTTVRGVLINNIFKIIPKKEPIPYKLLERLCKGFDSVNQAKEVIHAYGQRLISL